MPMPSNTIIPKPVVSSGFCGNPLKKSTMIVGVITLVFGVIFFFLSLVYMYFFVSPAHFVMSGENPVSLQAGFIICILVSAFLIYGVRQDCQKSHREEFRGYLIVILVILIVVDVTLVYFGIVVISYYLQLRDQFLNDPEHEPKPFDKIPA
ncbi:unnamed protein product [Notodromas monacha]|uniref:Uncharacterized protein n=1 Tax=Notodromas monacha TaxID=399045 RepID=A0A7R9BQ25_9CRUS|nr:unnamed protein product [Notodromas monacha]CAG0918058.1 unnamed protein product [Notodromas monacha]